MRTSRFQTLMLSAAALNPQWLVRPWQLTTRGYAILVALAAMVLIVSGFPTPMIGFTVAVALALAGSLRLARHGFTRADVATVLAILLVVSMLLLPEMERVRERSAGMRYFPKPVPVRSMALIRGEQVREPF